MTTPPLLIFFIMSIKEKTKQEKQLLARQKRFHDFITTEVDSKDLARLIRRYNFFIANLFLDADQNLQPTTWLSNTQFYLNEIAEILDPYFSKEKC